MYTQVRSGSAKNKQILLKRLSEPQQCKAGLSSRCFVEVIYVHNVHIVGKDRYRETFHTGQLRAQSDVCPGRCGERVAWRRAGCPAHNRREKRTGLRTPVPSVAWQRFSSVPGPGRRTWSLKKRVLPKNDKQERGLRAPPLNERHHQGSCPTSSFRRHLPQVP